MKKLLRIMPCVLCLAAAMPSLAALDLSASIPVEKTADTGAAAKSAALRQAREQAVINILSNHADSAAVSAAADKASDADLLAMIATTEVANEKSSATAYSATIKISLEESAALKWLEANGIENSISAATGAAEHKIPVQFRVNGLRDWAKLGQGLRDAGVWSGLRMDVSSIFGGRISAKIADGKRAALESAVLGMGWKVSENENGILEVLR